MRKPTVFLIGIGALAIGIVWLFVHRMNGEEFREIFSFEPKYEGHTFTYWMRHWYLNPWGSPVNAEAVDALQSMGPKATPYLVKWTGKPPTYGLDFNYPEHALAGFKVLGPAAKPAVPGLIKIIGQNQDYPERALELIGRDAVPTLANKLVETLSDTNNPFFFGGIRMNVRKTSGFYIRGCILNVFNQMGTKAEAAIPALITTVSTNLPNYREGLYQQNPYTTLATVGRNHPDVVVPVLVNKFASPGSERGKIAQAMAIFGTNQAHAFVPVLVAALSDTRTDDGSHIQIGKALTVIGASQPGGLVPVFLAALTEKSSPESVRCCIASYLAQVGINQPDIVVPALMTAYTNFSLYGRSSIAGALACFPKQSRPIAPLLLSDCEREAEHHWDNRWRINLTLAVKAIAPDMPGTLNPLLKDLDASQAGMRQQTIYALGRLGTNGLDAVPALLKCLSHPDSQTRIDATRALDEIGVTSDEFIADLGDNLSCTNHFMSQEAEGTLAKLANHSKLAFVMLIKKGVCGQISRDDRFQAKWSLVNISRDDPKFLLECLDDSEPAVRSGALVVFYDLARGVPQAIPKLRALSTSDPDPEVRSWAADVLKLQLQ